MSEYVLMVYKLGGNLGAFKTAYREIQKENNLPDIDFYTERDFNLEENLPWDFIEILPGKEFLKKEHARLLHR